MYGRLHGPLGVLYLQSAAPDIATVLNDNHCSLFRTVVVETEQGDILSTPGLIDSPAPEIGDTGSLNFTGANLHHPAADYLTTELADRKSDMESSHFPVCTRLSAFFWSKGTARSSMRGLSIRDPRRHNASDTPCSRNCAKNDIASEQ